MTEATSTHAETQSRNEAGDQLNGDVTSENAEGMLEQGRKDGTQEKVSLNKDDIFHILQNERRRQVLDHLKEVEGKVEMREIAEKIAAWENNTTVDNLYSDQRQRVYIALYQSHLPKLDDLGVIEYNQPRGTIEPTPLLEEVTKYLDSEPTHNNPSPLGLKATESGWIPPTVAVVSATAVVSAGGLFGLIPSSTIGLGVAAITAAVLVVIGLTMFARGS